MHGRIGRDADKVTCRPERIARTWSLRCKQERKKQRGCGAPENIANVHRFSKGPEDLKPFVLVKLRCRGRITNTAKPNPGRSCIGRQTAPLGNSEVFIATRREAASFNDLPGGRKTLAAEQPLHRGHIRGSRLVWSRSPLPHISS